MDLALLKKIGLTDSQAQSYSELVKVGRLTPPELAKITGESRTAAYMALAKLEEIGLAEQDKTVKKQTYLPTSPSNLDRYIEARRREMTEVEEQYRAGLSDLLTSYYEQRRQTGVQYFRGREGLRAMYEDHVRTGKDLYLVRTYADEDFFEDWLYEYMDKRAAAGIRTYALMPFNLRSYNWGKKNDERLRRDTAWYPDAAYTAPVEIGAYGDKVSIISFGEEAIGTILESPQIAHAMKDLFGLAKIGAKALMKTE